MRRLPVVLPVICLLPPARAGAPSPVPVAKLPARPTPRIPPDKIYHKKRCWPGCHFDPAYVHDRAVVSTDDFDEALTLDWTWINEDPSRWSLTEVPGFLHIVAQSGSISGDLQDVQNVLVHPAPDAHFDIAASVTSCPTSSSQSAAIFIQVDDGSLISLSRGYCQEGEGERCVGSGICLDGPEPNCTAAGVPTSADMTYLMLRRAGRTYVGYWLDEEEWVEVGRCFGAMAPVRVGLAATGIPVDLFLYRARALLDSGARPNGTSL